MAVRADIDDFSDYIEDILSQQESDDLEYKSAAGGFPGSFWDTYCAFANTDGGVIVLGVAEKKDGIFLDGLTIEQVEKYKRDFWNGVNNPATVSLNLMRSDDVKVVGYRGSLLMFFFVPRAAREDRPVFRGPQPYNGTFKRNNEGDYKCTQREVQRMFADADISRPADGRILKNYTMDDLDPESVAQYRQLFLLARPNHPWNALSDIDFLKKLGGFRRDRETGEEGFTLAALLMFGRWESIREEGCCPDFFPDYQEKTDERMRWTSRIYPDGTWEANIFQFYRRVLPRLQSALPNPFTLNGDIRCEETSAHVALREALINLCVHTDYTENASIVVQQYPDSFVFSNPGTLLVSLLQYYQGGESVCRNKTLQNMFMMLGTAEKAGSGVDKILQGWREANWRTPKLEIKSQPDKCVLTMKMASFIDPHVEEQLAKLYGNAIRNLDHNKLLVLCEAFASRKVTNESLRYVLPLHKADRAALLHSMCQQHLLEKNGHGRGTTYHLIQKVESSGVKVERNGDFSAAKVESSGVKVESNGDFSAAKVESSGVKVESNGDFSAAKVESSGVKVESNDDFSAAKVESSGVSVKKRFSYAKISAIICDLCKEWRSIQEISLATNRDSKYLINKVIPRMIRENRLEMLFAGSPKHPRQKYQTVPQKI